MNSNAYSSSSIRAGALHYVFGRGAAGIAGLGSVLLLARYMDVMSYAGYTTLIGLAALLGVLGSVGLERVVARYVPEGITQRNPEELAGLIWKTALIRLATSLAILLLAFVLWPWITRTLEHIGLDHLPLPLAVFLVAEALFQHLASVFQALMMQKTLTRLMIIQWLGRLLLIGWAAKSGPGITLDEALWITCIPESLVVSCSAITLANFLRLAGRRSHDQLPPSSRPWPPWSAVAAMAAHNYAFTLLAAPPQGYVMRLLISATLPVEIVAAYGFFQSLAEKARQYIPMHFFFSIIEPLVMARYVQDRNFALLSQRCEMIYATNLLVFVPAIVWVALAGNEITTLLGGAKFAGHSWILVLVMAQLLIGSHVVVLQLILNAVGQSRILTKASTCALVGFVGYTLLISRSTEIAIVGAPIVFSLIANLLIVADLKRLGYGYRQAWRGPMIMLVVGGMVWMGCIPLMQLAPDRAAAWLVAVVSGLIVFVAFSTGAFLLSAIDPADIRFMRSFITTARTGVEHQ